MNADKNRTKIHLCSSAFICGLILSAMPAVAADGLDSLSDDALLDELARRNQTALLERAFEINKTPEATRNGVRAIAALARLRADAGKLTDQERRATVANVCAGINTILPTMTDPKRVAEQADALIGAGVLRDVNTLEYWGPSVSAQAQLRPVVETVIKLLEKADALAQERAGAFAEKANPNVPADMKRVEEMEQLGLVAQQSKALAGYYLALCYDPSDANRAKVADESIAYLEGFDVEGNPARENLKLALGKLRATRGEFDKARADLDFVIKAGVGSTEGTSTDAAQQKLRQFEARYFRAVVEVQAKVPNAARAKYDELLAWQAANPSDDPAIATANALLDYRIAAIEPGQAERATTLLIDLLARRPDLEVPIMAQLRSGIAQGAAVSSLAPLQLRSLVIDAQEQVVRGQQDAQFKPDPHIVSRGLDAAGELVARRGKPGVDDRVVGDAQFLSGAFLESLDRKPEAAGRYLDFAESNKANVEPAKAALSNAQRLFAQLGGLKSGADAVTKLYDRILPLSLGEPFNQKELAYDWAFRLQQLDRPEEAAKWYAQVAKTDARYAASRYYLMVALSQSMDKLPAGAPRAAASKQIQSLADEVRADAGAAPGDPRKRQRLARTSLLAASIARTEQDDPQRALSLLQNFASSIEGLPDADELLGEAMFTRVQSNMQLGETDAAVKELVQLLDRSAGGRGAQVVFNMLSKLERDFGQAQANGDRKKMAQLQSNRSALTPYLVRWAEKNPNADVRKFTYSYRVYDAETQRMAATFLDDPAAQQARREQSLKLFEALDSEDGRKQYAASRDPAVPAKLAYDPQVALGLARIRYDAQDWAGARDAYARLLADRALGTPIATIREAGQEKQADNDAYWEATLRLIDAKVKAGDEVEPLKVLLREQTIRWGDRVGGKQWAGLAKSLREKLIPDFVPPVTSPSSSPSSH
jgi:hypothetical protein